MSERDILIRIWWSVWIIGGATWLMLIGVLVVLANP